MVLLNIGRNKVMGKTFWFDVGPFGLEMLEKLCGPSYPLRSFKSRSSKER
jgi:hypothetical protein